MTDETKKEDEEFIKTLKMHGVMSGFTDALMKNTVTIGMHLSALLKLKKQLMEEIELIKEKISSISEKKPHKCPICNGSSSVPGETEINGPNTCKACNGKCIVWG